MGARIIQRPGGRGGGRKKKYRKLGFDVAGGGVPVILLPGVGLLRWQDFADFFSSIDVRPVWAFLFAVFNYLICPDASYMPAIGAVWLAVILDLLTRLFANSKNAGGFLKAVKARAISSDTLFNRTVIKVVAYLSLQILAGLSMRVLPLQQVSIAVATIVYSFLFIRESTSIVENLVEAGAEDLKPLLFWLKKKETDLTEDSLRVQPMPVSPATVPSVKPGRPSDIDDIAPEK